MYGGNPVACAASLAVLEELFEGGVLENCRKMGEFVRSNFYELQKKYDVIGDPVFHVTAKAATEVSTQ